MFSSSSKRGILFFFSWFLFFISCISFTKNNIYFEHSQIFSPIGTVSPTPLVVGIIKSEKKAIENCRVRIYIDGNPLAIVTSDENGIFWYQVRAQSLLSEGTHFVYAVTEEEKIYIRGTQFQISYDTINSSTILRSGNVSAQNSHISFPANGTHVNEDQVTIVCYLADSSNNPVANETVTLTVDSTVVTTAATSNQNGFVSYKLTQQQALGDGQYTVAAYAQESDIDLEPQTFTVDTVAPIIPVILTPILVIGNSATIRGLSESWATITVFLDGNTYGEISYADENGNWEIQFDGLTTGLHSVRARQSDLAMNESAASLPLTFLVL